MLLPIQYLDALKFIGGIMNSMQRNPSPDLHFSPDIMKG